MPLRCLLLQAWRCSSQPPPRLSGLIRIFRSLSILPSRASVAPSRLSPAQVQLPQTLTYSDANPLGAGFHIDVVDSDLWPTSFGFSSDPKRDGECLDGFQEHNKEEEDMPDSDDEIDDMRHRKKLFYKLDRGSKEFEENNMPLHRRWKRDKGNAKNPSECKVEPDKSAPPKAPKLKAKRAVQEDSIAEVKRERMPTFNQMTDPYHHPFCLDIHVSKGSVRACFVHRVTSRVVSVAHSISKDMKVDLGSRKGIKACVAVGALLAKRAIEDDIHNAVYTPRNGDKIEGKIEIVLRGIIENGVDVKVKLKQRKTPKTTPVVHRVSLGDGSPTGQHKPWSPSPTLHSSFLFYLEDTGDAKKLKKMLPNLSQVAAFVCPWVHSSVVCAELPCVRLPPAFQNITIPNVTRMARCGRCLY